MSDISNSNITTTILTRIVRDDNRKDVTATLVLGFGASLTYPTGGVPLLPGQFAFKMIIDAVEVMNDNGAGYKWQFMPATGCLRMFYPTTAGGINAVATELSGGSTAPGSDITIQIQAHGR